MRCALTPARCALVFLLGLVTCKREDPPPSYPAPVATFPSQVDPRSNTAPPPATPVPAAAPPAGAAAMGFLCATDADIQCPFARCVKGHCGGCAAPSDCKAGVVCVATWVGFACLPGGPSAPPLPAATVATLPPTTVPATPLPVPAASPTSADPMERARIRCTDRTNAYRASVGAPPVQRRPEFETCADAAAGSDAQARTVHGAFGRCRESAQNECPAWSGAVDTVIDQCLDMMFAEGPGTGSQHGHYVNMTNRSYTQVACGVSAGPKGEVWIVQNFYR